MLDERSLQFLDEMRLRSLSDSFTRADRALSGVPGLNVTVQRGSAGQAYTTNGQVFLSVATVRELSSPRGMVDLLGMNYHELSHVFFTPANIVTGYAAEWNLLDDQRIESLMVSLYPGIAPYLRQMINTHLLQFSEGTTDVPETQWVLVAGRRFVDPAIRSIMRTRFVNRHGEAVAVKIEELVDRFKHVPAWSRHMEAAELEKAELICAELHAVLNHLHEMTPPPDNHPDPSVDPRGSKRGSGVDQIPTRGKRSEDNTQEAQEFEAEGGDQFDATATDEEWDANAPDEDGDGDGDGDASGDGQEGPQDGRSGPNGKGQGNDTPDKARPGGGAGKGSGSLDLDADDALIEDLMNAAAASQVAVMANSEVAKAVRGMHAALNQSDSGMVHPNVTERLASQELMQRARDFTTEIVRMIPQESDPGWEGGYGSGKLNTKAWMAGAEFDDLFDRWNPGWNDSFELDAVVAVDRSSSMSSQMVEACESAFVIRKGIEDAGGTCASFVWSSGPVSYLAAEGRLGNRVPVIVHGGTTDPGPAMADAMNRFADPRRRNKNRVFFMVTDGSWDGSTRVNYNTLLSEMMAMGVVVVLIGLGTEIPYGRPCDVRANYAGLKDMVSVAQKTVQAMFAKVAAVHGMGGR